MACTGTRAALGVPGSSRGQERAGKRTGSHGSCYAKKKIEMCHVSCHCLPSLCGTSTTPLCNTTDVHVGPPGQGQAAPRQTETGTVAPLLLHTDAGLVVSSSSVRTAIERETTFVGTDATTAPATDTPMRLTTARIRADAALWGYHLLDVLGMGTFGRVYACETHAGAGSVALKVCAHADGTAVEVAALRALAPHGNIAQLLDAGKFACGAAFTVTEHGGVSLYDAITNTAWHPTEDTARQLIDAVRHVHAHGFCHMDLKLENAVVDATERVRLVDFGLAQRFQPQMTAVVGSLKYAAPEVLSRRAYHGYLADAWSMAVVLFTLFHGFFPVEEARMSDWRFRRLHSAQACHTSDATGALRASAVAHIHDMYPKGVATRTPLSRYVVVAIDAMLQTRMLMRADVHGAHVRAAQEAGAS